MLGLRHVSAVCREGKLQSILEDVVGVEIEGDRVASSDVFLGFRQIVEN